MESLIPSEIARLVIGYLEDQKCDEAAKMFLETSPHLQECRMVVASGKTFSRLVHAMTLIDILEKHCAINTIIQEGMNKVADSDQLKQCGDFLEQLRCLIGSRSQRFVVNINVPSQNSVPTSGGSPIISSNIRKRQRSGSDRDRDRCKRFAKSQPQTPEKHDTSENSQLYSDTVEATPVESLPGHIDSRKSSAEKSLSFKQKSKEVNPSKSERNACETRLYENEAPAEQTKDFQWTTLNQKSKEVNLNLNECNDYAARPHVLEVSAEQTEGVSDHPKSINFQATPGKCTMSTSTEELTKSYPSTGVQTGPWDLLDFEGMVNDDRHENLSLLTKEMLHCKELHEQIAENINRSGIRDDAYGVNVACSNNPGIFKSIVEETMVATTFQQVVGSVFEITDTDTSPDNGLDSRNNPEFVEKEQQQELYGNNVNNVQLLMPDGDESRIEQMGGSSEVPLKERLRSSSRQQNFRPENESNNPDEQGNQISALDDQNDAAIQSIINANSANIEPSRNEENATSVEKIIKEPEAILVDSEPQNQNLAQSVLSVGSDDSIQIIEPPTDKPEVTKEKSAVTNAKGRKTSKRKESKPVKKVPPEMMIPPASEMMVTPTLVVCSKDDVGSFLEVTTLASYPSTSKRIITTISNSQFVPIAPKNFREPTHEPIYLKTLNVTHRIPPEMKKKSMLSKIKSIPLPLKHPVAVPLTNPIPVPLTSTGLPLLSPIMNFTENRIEYPVLNSLPNITDTCENCNDPNKIRTECVKDLNPKESTVKETNLKDPNFIESNMEKQNLQEPSIKESTIKEPNTAPLAEKNQTNNLEHITLYGNENSTAAFLETDGISSFNVDASISFSLSGLSPYLKTTNTKTKDTAAKEAPSVTENIADMPSSSSVVNRSVTRRTPMALTKSWSKNNRKSFSTPRRRSSHVRALDFDTPSKSSSSASKVNSKTSPNAHNRSKSLCRASLFKSPPFNNSSPVAQKLKSPVKDYRPYKIPIATRSPAPKLMGGWEKVTGMDMILGNGNSNPAAVEKIEESVPQKPKVLKSWDTELRMALNAGEPITKEERNDTESKKKKSVKTARKSKKGKVSPVKGRKRKSQDSKQSQRKKNSKTPVKSVDLSDAEEPSSENVSDPKVLSNVLPTDSSFSSTAEKIEVPESTSQLLKTPEPDPKPVENLPSTSKPSTPANKRSDVLITEKKSGEIVKKYAQLTSLPRSEVKINSEFLKTSPKNTGKMTQMPNMIELETPRKLENTMGIPPTPRFLSPNNSAITPFMKISDDSGKIPNFFPTPDFAPTPDIKSTPNLAGENTKDAIKKGEYSSCSPYYQPSSEVVDGPEKLKTLSKNSQNDSNNTTETREIVNTCVTKVAEFQVIKGNLPREEAEKEELKISSSSIEITESVVIREEIAASSVIQEADVSTESFSEKSSQESDSESSDSDSNSSSSFSSSSSSSSSSSDSSNTSATETPFSSAKKNTNTSDKSFSDTSNPEAEDPENQNVEIQDHDMKDSEDQDHDMKDSEDQDRDMKDSEDQDRDMKDSEDQDHNMNDAEIQDFEIKDPDVRNPEIRDPEIKEASPQKMFSVTNTEDSEDKETPAKNELLLEADISETPSSSKTGTDTPTNLTTKISAIMTSEKNLSQSKLNNAPTRASSSKPTIVSIERIAPIDCNALKGAKVLIKADDIIPGPSLQARTANPVDDKLKTELELKRERLKESLCGGSRGRGKPSGRGIHNPVRRGRYSVTKKAMLQNLKLNLNIKNQSATEENKITETTSKSKEPTNPDHGEETGVEKDQVVSKKSLNPKKEEKLDKDKETETKSIENELKDKRERSEVKDDVNFEESKKPAMPNVKRKMPLKKTKVARTTAMGKKKKLLEDKELLSSETEKEDKSDNKLDAKNKRKEKDGSSQVDCKLKEIISNVEDQKFAMKAKVDQVKRDLFSDEEVMDQRTTRSKTRQISDAQRRDTSDHSSDQVAAATINSSKDRILESLQLVPANKSEINESCNLQNAIDSFQREFHFVYDETSAVKKRKQKYNLAEFELEIQNEEGTETVTVKATPFEEIFSISPKPKKRVRKTPVTNVKKASEVTKLEVRSYEKPLASSSPILKAAIAQSKDGKDDNVKNEKSKAVVEKEKQKGKSRKRKASTTEEQQVQSKLSAPDQINELLDETRVAEMLSRLHGPD